MKKMIKLKRDSSIFNEAQLEFVKIGQLTVYLNLQANNLH